VTGESRKSPASSWEATDWRTIVEYYDRLVALDGSPLTALNRAVALAMVDGPEPANTVAQVFQKGYLLADRVLHVELDADAANGIVIPDSAVLESGTRQVIFVETAPGQFTARNVSVGPRGNGKALVREGLAEGERVAVSANFLLDSESRLRQVR